MVGGEKSVDSRIILEKSQFRHNWYYVERKKDSKGSTTYIFACDVHGRACGERDIPIERDRLEERFRCLKQLNHTTEENNMNYIERMEFDKSKRLKR